MEKASSRLFIALADAVRCEAAYQTTWRGIGVKSDLCYTKRKEPSAFRLCGVAVSQSMAYVCGTVTGPERLVNGLKLVVVISV